MLLSELPRQEWVGKRVRFTRKTDSEIKTFSYEAIVVSAERRWAVIRVVAEKELPERMIDPVRLEVVTK